MKWVKGILIISIALQFIGCSLNSSEDNLGLSAQRNIRGTAPNGVGTGSEPSATTKWGQIAAADANFVMNIKQLVSIPASGDPLLGAIQGVMFWGHLPSVNGVNFNSNRSGYFSGLSSNSSQMQLNIEIWDEYSGKEYQNYGLMLPYTFYFGKSPKGFRGDLKFYANSSNLNVFLLQAKDKYGEILFAAGYPFNRSGMNYNPTGGINGSTITGEVYYTQTVSGNFIKIGNFQVPTCGFFVCQ